MSNEVVDVLGPQGPFAQAAGYEVRAGQTRMAAAVEQLFDRGGTLFVEAPTGVGKSRAYGVPAVRAAAAGKRVVIVTANIALQEQLIRKDLPAIAEACPQWPFKAALAKGLGNYVCRLLWDDLRVEIAMRIVPGEEWGPVTDWIESTETGDLSEFRGELTAGQRARCTMSSDDCPGKVCRYHHNCFGQAARRAYSAANVIVTNYHLFFCDLVLRSQGVELLPAYDLVVLDEAHQAVDIARDFFGWRATHGGVLWATRRLSDPELKQRVKSESEQLFRALGEPEDRRPRLTQPGEVQAERLALLLEKSKADLEVDSQDSGRPMDEVQKLRIAANRCTTLAGWLRSAEKLEDDNGVYYVEKPVKGDCWALGCKPLHVAKMLDMMLFDSDAVHAVLATSATLTVGGAFDFVLDEIGAVEAETMSVPSPFDIPEQAFVVVPTDLPDPKSAAFAERVAEVVVDTIRWAGGRTLALFTSYRVLQYTYGVVTAAGFPYRILRQGDRPRTQLIDEFRQDETSVLLGTSSFWEGVDVRGDACRAVVMDRLPFDQVSDPVVDAMDECTPRAFPCWMLPRAVLRFRQGFGRLIRSQTDRGAIVMCDRRLIDKPYGSKFLRSLPRGVRVFRSFEGADRGSEM